MTFKKVPFNFRAKIWKHKSEGGWHFVSLPQDLSNEIRSNFGTEEEGWGRLKIRAMIGSIEWDTSIWFDTKLNGYVLPVKKEIRITEHLNEGDDLQVKIWI